MAGGTTPSAETQEQLNAHIEGFLQRVFYVCFTNPARSFEEIVAAVPEHLAYLQRLEEEEKLFAAGPLLDKEGRFTGPGMLVYRAGSLDEARAIAEGDPMHARGLRTFELRPWQVNEGVYRLRIRYSTGTYTVD